MRGQKIAVVLPDLRPGGAERLHVQLASDWVARGCEVEFVLRNATGDLLGLLPNECRVVDLHARRVRSSVVPLRRYLIENSPDALLAAMWPLTSIVPATAWAVGCGCTTVVSEHSPLSLAYKSRGWIHNGIMAASVRVGYRLASSRVAVSSGVAEDMAKLSGLSIGCIEVVHNPAAQGIAARRNHWTLPIPRADGALILSVGTLKGVKRHDLLIRAFAAMNQSDVRLCILGEGVERPSLERLAQELGVGNRVLLPGYQSETASWYAQADLFVLASDYEGFGNVIVEALEQGTPVVSTDCPVGPREILQGGRFGALVPVGDVDALSAAMTLALCAPHDRDALRRRAADFSLEKASSAYLDLLLPGWRGSAA